MGTSQLDSLTSLLFLGISLANEVPTNDPEQELDWKWIDVDFLDGHNTKDRVATPAVSIHKSPTGDTVRAPGSSCEKLSDYSVY